MEGNSMEHVCVLFSLKKKEPLARDKVENLYPG